MRRALVTGADGFIGSHLVETLLAEGYAVRALSYYNAFGHRGWLEAVPGAVEDTLDVVQGDVRDAAQMRSLIDGCDVVFHLAALIGIPYSYEAPASYLGTNIEGTLNVLQAARDHGGVKVIQTSTSEVYGTARRVPIDEEHPLQAQSPYAASKIAADQLALSFHASFDLPVVVLRPFNTYGPRQSMRAIIPTVIRQLATGNSRLALGNLTPTRDLTYVTDTVRGFLLADRQDAALGEVINLGTGHEISIGDLASLIARLMGKKVEIVRDESRVRPTASEVERLCSDARKADRLLGWQPEASGAAGLEAGLRRTIDWVLAQPELSRERAAEYVR